MLCLARDIAAIVAILVPLICPPTVWFFNMDGCDPVFGAILVNLAPDLDPIWTLSGVTWHMVTLVGPFWITSLRVGIW